MIPKTRWARTVDGAYIAYQDFGKGPITLVVIHGWISHLEVYWEQPRYARFMNRLSKRMRVLNFDKRGIGMSDRFARAPSLEMRMDDVRAVMDAADVERAAIFGWGMGGPPSAFFFAATHPERTVAVCTDGMILFRLAPDFPWGTDEVEQLQSRAALLDTWGDEERSDHFLRDGWGDRPEDVPAEDPEFRRWASKWARYSATPGAYAAFDDMWYETDVRDVLAAVRTPTAVLYKEGVRRGGWGGREPATYVAERIPGCHLVGVRGVAAVPWIEEPEPVVNALEEFFWSVSEEEADLNRVLATVLFTDIVGSTERVAQLGDRAWKDLVEQHHQTARALLARYRGNEIDTAGDGFFASFDGPARAVRCARAITEAVKPLGLDSRWRSHGRNPDDRRKDRRDHGQYRRPDRRHRTCLRGSRFANRQRSHRRIRARPGRRRRAQP